MTGETDLPPVRLEPPVVTVDGRPAVSVGSVVVKIVAKKYSSGGVYYEVKDLIPDRAAAFAILQPRVESIIRNGVPDAEAANTRLVVEHTRTVTENDLIQVHVTLEVERADAAGNEHPPTLVAACRTELWGTTSVRVGERKLIDEGGKRRWGPLDERLESQTRTDVESDPSPEVPVSAGPEWLPESKGTVRPGMTFPVRRLVGHGTFVVKRGSGGPVVE
jgi:hypothetical protein